MKHATRTWLVLCVLLPGVSVMAASPSVLYIGLPDLDVKMFSGTSPEFADALSQSVDAQSIPPLRPILPYCVIVRNDSSERILMVTVRIRKTDHTGKTTVHDITHGTRDNDFVSMISPGQMVLITPVGGLNKRLPSSSLLRLDGDDTSMVESNMLEVADEYALQSKVEVLMDAVVFADGRLVGQDLSNTLETVNTMAEVEDLVISTTLTKSGDEISGYLAAEEKQVSAIAKQTPKSAEFTRQRANLARELLNIRQAFTSEDKFRQYLQTRVASRIPRLWRQSK